MASTNDPKACNSDHNAEKGVALLMTLFVLTLATLIIFELGKVARTDLRLSRGFAEGVQGDYVLKSGINLARVLLEIPKLPGVQEDWLGEPWALISTQQELPIGGVIGEPKLYITDEDSKIDIDWIMTKSRSQPPPSSPNPQSGKQPLLPSDYWKTVLADLMLKLGFVQEQYDSALHRTIGDVGYDAQNQVAQIIDWADTDRKSFTQPGFGTGIESEAPRGWFYNRKFQELSELLLVPGMTKERLRRLAPFVKVKPPGIGTTSTITSINVNTAAPEILTSLQVDPTQVNDLLQQRQSFPLNRTTLDTLAQNYPDLRQYLKVTSTTFSAYVRITLPSSTRWAKAIIAVRGGGAVGQSRGTSLRLVEYF
jgi:type II secretory pathway component PulK